MNRKIHTLFAALFVLGLGISVTGCATDDHGHHHWASHHHDDHYR